MPSSHTAERGFTLIELSIVLIIIGLIVGGVLVGQDLVRAAGVRATISQVERYNTAANTFRGKYGALPGDIQPNLVTQFGFTAVPTRPGTAGQGDGNGVLEGYSYQNTAVWDFAPMTGETAWFWEDLSTNSRLIEGTFNTSGIGMPSGTLPTNQFFPEAKLGNGNYLYVWSFNGTNYFGLSLAISSGAPAGVLYGSSTNPGLSVAQAYAIDKKMDDGLPQSGNVTAEYQNWSLYAVNGFQLQNYGAFWAAGGGTVGANIGTAANPGSSTTCYDNGNVGGGVQQYSVEISNGNNTTCALSFRFQ